MNFKNNKNNYLFFKEYAKIIANKNNAFLLCSFILFNSIVSFINNIYYILPSVIFFFLFLFTLFKFFKNPLILKSYAPFVLGFFYILINFVVAFIKVSLYGSLSSSILIGSVIVTFMLSLISVNYSFFKTIIVNLLLLIPFIFYLNYFSETLEFKKYLIQLPVISVVFSFIVNKMLIFKVLTSKKEKLLISAKNRSELISFNLFNVLNSIEESIFKISLSNHNKLVIDKNFNNNYFKQNNLDFESIIKSCNFLSLKNDELLDLLKTVLNNNILTYEFNVDKLPNQFEFNEKYFSINFYPIIKNDMLMSFYISINDISKLKKQEYHLKQKSKEVELMFEIMKNDFNLINKVFNEILDLIKEAKNNINEPKLSKNQLHTAKGLARTYNLINLAHSIHLLEDSFDNLIFFEDLSDSYTNLLKKLNIDKDLSVKISVNSLNYLQNNLKWNQEDLNNLKDLKSFLFLDKNSIEKSLSKNLSSVISVVNKPMPKIKNLLNDNILIYDQAKVNIEKMLPHIAGNLMDHGIETIEERKNKNKEEQGTIFLSSNLKDYYIFFKIKDDGQGVDLIKLKQKLIRSNIEIENKQKQDLINHLFDNSFSLKDSVSSISGRGIGLNAIKNEMDQIGGDAFFLILKEEGDTVFVELNIKVPLKFVKII